MSDSNPTQGMSWDKTNKTWKIRVCRNGKTITVATTTDRAKALSLAFLSKCIKDNILTASSVAAVAQAFKD